MAAAEQTRRKQILLLQEKLTAVRAASDTQQDRTLKAEREGRAFCSALHDCKSSLQEMTAQFAGSSLKLQHMTAGKQHADEQVLVLEGQVQTARSQAAVLTSSLATSREQVTQAVQAQAQAEQDHLAVTARLQDLEQQLNTSLQRCVTLEQLSVEQAHAIHAVQTEKDELHQQLQVMSCPFCSRVMHVMSCAASNHTPLQPLPS